MSLPKRVASKVAAPVSRKSDQVLGELVHLIHAIKNELTEQIRTSHEALSEELGAQGRQVMKSELAAENAHDQIVALREETSWVHAELQSLKDRVAPRSGLSRVGQSAITVLRGNTIGQSATQRVAMSLSCTDCETIPKVPHAGQVQEDPDHGTIQLMHTGLKVVQGGYYGDWTAEIIAGLKGHHEPQEERVFHEILQRIDSDTPTMIELGCFWAYYSLWFLQRFPGGVAICTEPDPDHLDIGRANARINSLNPHFQQAAAGGQSGVEVTLESELHPGVFYHVPIRTVPDLLEEHRIETLDLLHMDIQGFELEALEATESQFRSGAIRFLVVSTHHHLVSGDPLTHERCLDWLTSLGAHIVAEHSVAESFSGDGLIVASFDDRDSDFTVQLSHNRASNSLFESPLLDLDRMMQAYEELRSHPEQETRTSESSS